MPIFSLKFLKYYLIKETVSMKTEELPFSPKFAYDIPHCPICREELMIGLSTTSIIVFENYCILFFSATK